MDGDHRIANFSAKFAVITCSSTRKPENDVSGNGIVAEVTKAGHSVPVYAVVNDDVAEIRHAIKEALKKCDAAIITGGTGITSRDVTLEAVSPIAEYEMSGFGHLFSQISFREIGTSAVMSRSTAYIVDRKPVFCLPGSPAGSLLGVREIILKQIDHIIHELRR